MAAAVLVVLFAAAFLGVGGPRPVSAQMSGQAGLAGFQITPGAGLEYLRLLAGIGLFTTHFGEPRRTVSGDHWKLYEWWIDGKASQAVQAIFNTDPGRRMSQLSPLTGADLNYVWEINVFNWPRYRTADGLGVGSTETEIQRAMGPPSKTTSGADGRALWYESRGITFFIMQQERPSSFGSTWRVMSYCPFQDRKNCLR